MNSKNNHAYITVDMDGSKESIDELYDLYKEQLYRFVYRYSNDRQFSIDIVQDTFEKLIKKKHQYIPEKGSFKTYLFQIAYNTMMTKMKRRQTLQALFPFLISSSVPTIDLEEKMVVRQALQSLPEEQRAVVLLIYYHDVTQKEAAAILRIPLGTVKSRLHHALKKLKHDLEVDFNEG
ncbi:RNA polymerase sigma factor [Bacillus sp. FJAT-50079]|uniref:RNA polymerase sigma factor n=1 Tax=Bacillus sp. FJAT-50079 TaxID=2833577 RepID=UPI001BC96469|nr:RNA polymerase sigma factor [Bacillus sp. FJAT-50079]MBS4208392.1 RNA polymerase sigma factor [Bacillus sp. FJAT-50079]